MMPPVSKRFVVVGAGPAGLAAARVLAISGADVQVLESGSTPGGRTVSITRHGIRINAGATFFTSFYARCLDLSAQLGVDLISPQLHPGHPGDLRRFVTPAGQLVFEPGDLRSLLSFPLVPPLQKARLLATLLSHLPRRRLHIADLESLAALDDGESAEAWGHRVVGVEATDYVLRQTVEPFFYFQAADSSAAIARCLLRHAIRWSLLTPTGGMGSFCDALARGVDVHTGHRVRAVTRNASGYTVEHDHGSEQADGVVLAVPAPALRQIDVPLSDADRADIDTVRYEPCTKLLLGYDRPVRLDPPVLTPLGPGRHPIIGIRALSTAGAPDLIPAGREVATVLTMGWRARELAGQDEDAVAAALTSDAEMLGMNLPTADWRVVVPWDAATVVPTPGSLRRMAALGRRRRTGVVLAGDWTSGISTVESSVRSGEAAARSLLQG
ncbi:hypothetical protein ASE20_10750 [Nocardioides sp. Root240]|nr:hypothetical protein ASE20_10750 [Nocardioides sp. Root240]